nr:helix-turn-helix transcriptional regulator [Bacillus fonticola]
MLQNSVKMMRARESWTQGDLAQRVGVTRQTIGFIEKGDYSPSIELALKIAQEFGEKVDDLFWLEGGDEL